MQTSTETPASRGLPGTGVTQERPTPFQALPEPQDRKGSAEPQGNEALWGIPDFRAFQASPPLPTSLGYLVTQGLPGYLARKVTEAPRGRQGLLLFPEAKEMRGCQASPETQGARAGSGTQGPRADPACSGSREKKGPEESKDSWETRVPPGVSGTEAPRDPKETEDSQVPPVLWGPQGL